MSGNPARPDGLARFIDYAQQFADVAFMRRVDIARNFAEQYPASKAFSDVALVREPSASSVAISSGGPV
jgi:hypothetical protein